MGFSLCQLILRVLMYPFWCWMQVITFFRVPSWLRAVNVHQSLFAEVHNRIDDPTYPECLWLFFVFPVSLDLRDCRRYLHCALMPIVFGAAACCWSVVLLPIIRVIFWPHVPCISTCFGRATIAAADRSLEMIQELYGRILKQSVATR